MKIRKCRPEDCAEVARLHRQTIKHVNANDYPPEVIRAWATTTAKDHRESIIQKAGKYVDRSIEITNTKSTKNTGMISMAIKEEHIL